MHHAHPAPIRGAKNAGFLAPMPQNGHFAPQTSTSTTATLILFFGAKTSTFAAYQTTIGGQEPSTNVKVSL